MSGRSITQYFPFMRVKITDQSVHGESGDSALIRMVPDLRCQPLCHRCGSPTHTVHSQGYRRFLRDLNLADAWVGLEEAAEGGAVVPEAVVI